ncbi:hypothetical protein [Flavobacterium sp. GT3R68]|uniref:hypothetical protein n=1 Tax=Flavobacterium sp. GT3R68 TaxID=2594437 RepID=UPI000F8787C2|nr:hypothetical protein [Flavobacterium sp. GT3R68]RTY91381.1 hypothetical protein EKL32_19325 [Flavobacterium sp. GSN2]TRW94007.1 hypothetical protein FNW07_03590 [Flavobacterium sp. GT3R68]
MKNNFKIFSVIFLLLSQINFAQTVNVTVQVLPPYSTYLTDYLNSPSKVVFTLLSYSNASVYLKANITGDNGISISTSDSYRPATPIQLVAYQPKMMTGIDLKNYLDLNSVIVTGINKNDLFKGSGLPEGSYTICIQVLDFSTGQPLSTPKPSGCSNPFDIHQIAPPQLVSPPCDEPVVAGNIQNVIFSWLPSAGAPAGSQYKLKIVELNPITRNPNEAMNSATTPAFFETTTNSFSYVYGPAQPPLKKDKKYAWRVTLLPTDTRFNAGGAALNVQNKGNSEVCSFVYKNNVVAQSTATPGTYNINLITPIQGAKINNGYGLEFFWSQSKKWVVKYEVQFTDHETQNKKITNWTALPENLFSLKNAFYASKEVAYTTTKLTLPQSFTAKNGKIAWRVMAYDNAHKAIDSSRIETYEVVDAPLTDRIKLIAPIKGEKINNGYGLEFSWTASKKPVANYQLQFTDRETQDKKITNWNTLTDAIFTKKNAFYASKDIGNKLKIDLPPTFTTGNGKIVWRIVAFNQGKKAIDSSAIDIYEVVTAPSTDRIKLVSPIAGKKITSGYGLKYEWEASKKKTITGYRVQFTDRYSQNKEITDWNNLNEKLFNGKNASFASNDTKELFINLPNSFTTGVGKMAWRVVALHNKTIVDSSKIEIYELIEDTSELAKIKGFAINGYYVQVNQISNKDQDKFSGSGEMLLWVGGKKIIFNFKDLKIRPVSYNAKLKKNIWGVIDGTLDIDAKKGLINNRFDLSTEKDCDGAFQLTLNSMKLYGKLEGAMDDKTNLYKVSKDVGTTDAKIIGKWMTNWFIPKNGKYSNDMYEFVSYESTIKMSFANKFDGFVNLNSDKDVSNLANGGIDVTFGGTPGDMKLSIKGLEGQTDLSGTVRVSGAQPSAESDAYLTNLSIPFKNKKNLNFYYTFEKPLKWRVNDDGSVYANVSETYVHLSDNGQLESKFENYNNGLNFDKFGVLINLPKKIGATTGSTLNMSFDKVYNKGNGYTSMSKQDTESKSNVDLAGFTSKLAKSSFKIDKNKLVFLKIEGEMYVPFINDWAGLTMDIDSKKIQEIQLDIDYTKKYYLSKDNSGSSAYMTVFSGRLENNAVVISSNLSVKNGQNKGFETIKMNMCDMYIDPSGAVSFNTNFSDNTESVCEGTKEWAKYYGFTFTVDKMKIKRNTSKTDVQFLFSGDVTLGPNIASGRKEMGFTYHGTSAQPGLGYNMINTNGVNFNPNSNLLGMNSKGPNDTNEDYIINNSLVENSIEIADDGKAISGNYEDGSQKFGGGFKMTQNATWGNCFELGGSYETKEPSTKELSAKMILGKTLPSAGNYTYWFFEFAQKGFVSIPIIPGILEAHGFGGKAYYQMEVEYDNMGKISNMKPNNAYSLGIAAEADVRTSYDQGATLHGHVQIVTQFQGWSIDGISYFIKGDAISTSSDSPGLIQARLNGQLNWVDKYIDGKGQIWGGVKDIVCINEGAANEDAIFFHFGADDFYMNVGTPENPITAEVMCGSGFNVGIWLGFDKKQLGFGFAQHYDSGWKGLDLGIASAEGRLISNFAAGVNVQYSPFQATGTASFDGRAYGKGCVDFKFYEGCIGGSCGVSANLSVSMPNPVVFQGSVACDVHRWIPDFTLNAKWSSNGGFSIWL